MSYETKREDYSSTILDRTTPVIRYGSTGEIWLYLSTSGGDETEAERYGLDRVATEPLQSGKMQLYCVDAQGPTSLFDDELAPVERIARYARMESHLREEWIPSLLRRHSVRRISLVGASYGAFVAANLAFKIPECIERVVAFGGVFDMSHRFDGFHDSNVYFHTPLEFVPQLNDSAVLDKVRAGEPWRLYAAQEDPWLADSARWEQVLREKQISCKSDLWGSPHGHHESTWCLQWQKVLAEIYSLET